MEDKTIGAVEVCELLMLIHCFFETLNLDENCKTCYKLVYQAKVVFDLAFGK